jgi:hypothetical protein
MNRMSVKEFREIGFLQELNRQFLHPLGLALEVRVDRETGKEEFGEVWQTDDAEGFLFDEVDMNKVSRVRTWEKDRHAPRSMALGYLIQLAEKKRETL